MNAQEKRQRELSDLPLSELIDLLLIRTKQLLAVTHEHKREEALELSAEIEKIHRAIRIKRGDVPG